MGVANNKIVKNITWIVACKIVQSLLTLVIGMISARYLGPSNYGLISYASSIVAFVLPIAQLGIRNILVEEIVSHPEREGKILGTSLVMSIVSSIMCIIGCIIFVQIVNAGEKDTLVVCGLYSISLIFQMIEMLQYWFQAKLLSKYTSIVSLCSYAIVTLYKVFLLVTGKSIYWFAISYTLDTLIISISLVWLYRKLNHQKLEFSFGLVKYIFSRSKYYIVSSMMVTIFSQTDRIMLKTMVGNAENGFYATAFTCAGITGFVFVAIIDSFRPVIFECKKNNQSIFEEKMSLLYSIVICLALFQSVFMTIFAKIIITILYGDAYVAAIPILRIITWYVAFSYMGTIRNIWMLAEEKQKYLWSINLVGAILNLVGNYFLIPVLDGIGAAIATVFTQFFTNYILCLIIKPMRDNVKLINRSLNPAFLYGYIIKKK